MKLVFVVEGLEDKRFLEDFVMFHFRVDLKPENFILVDGKAEKLHLVKTKLESAKAKGDRIVVVFDADDRGVEGTLRDINSRLRQFGLEVNDQFLFPDNQSSGNLETLLRQCIPEQNLGLFSCISAFQQCKNWLKLANDRIIGLKEELMIYHGSFSYAVDSKASMRSYLIHDLWNLNAPASIPLKNFLRTIFV